MEQAGLLPVLLVTGTLGSGKTVVVEDIGELLEDGEPRSAIVDLDWLGWVSGSSRSSDTIDGLILSNLAAVWPNYLAAGAGRLVLARTVLDRELIDGLDEAIGPVTLTIVRVTSSPDTIAERLAARDTGAVLEQHLAEASKFDKILDELRVEDLRVSNDGRPIREVFEEIVARAEWG